MLIIYTGSHLLEVREFTNILRLSFFVILHHKVDYKLMTDHLL
jgi:hypothetical protein